VEGTSAGLPDSSLAHWSHYTQCFKEAELCPQQPLHPWGQGPPTWPEHKSCWACPVLSQTFSDPLSHGWRAAAPALLRGEAQVRAGTPVSLSLEPLGQVAGASCVTMSHLLLALSQGHIDWDVDEISQPLTCVDSFLSKSFCKICKSKIVCY
jgi:hypothetical protein